MGLLLRLALGLGKGQEHREPWEGTGTADQEEKDAEESARCLARKDAEQGTSTTYQEIQGVLERRNKEE